MSAGADRRMTGGEHYREGERLLAAAREIPRRDDGTCPEADRMIAEAQAHMLAALAGPALANTSRERQEQARRTRQALQGTRLPRSPDEYFRAYTGMSVGEIEDEIARRLAERDAQRRTA